MNVVGTQVRLYIAGPMTGLPEFNYPAFRAAEQQLRAVGCPTLNPVNSEASNPTPGVPQEWVWYMRQGLRMVLNADAVATLPGWRQSRGACLEVHVATILGYEVREVQAWLDGAA